MGVEPGYKQTEVGILPDDWNVRSLAELCTKITDGTHDTPTPVRSGVPFLTAIHIKEGFVDFGNCLYLTEDDHRVIFARCDPRRGDILMVNIGAGVGTTALVEVDFEFSLKNVALLKPATREVSGRYLNYALVRRKPAITQALSSGGAQPFLSLTLIGRIRVAAPSLLKEQEAIAGALSDVDALLSGLDRLIAKKRDLKQAAMQQLLTGETRLPGFSGEWEVGELGRLGSIAGAGVDKKIRPGEPPVRLVNYMDVYRRSFIRSTDLDHVVSASPEQAARCAVRKGDVLFTPSSEMPFDIAASAVAVEDIPDACYSYHLVRLRLNEDWDLHFRAYAFKTQAFLDQAARTSEGSGVRYVITQGKFRQLTIRYPSDKAEQTAIAAVLSDMDAELSALEARRDKTRDLKQAMMRELLTGRTRFV